MANPQKENGYTGIANELFEAIIRFRIAGEVRQVFDAIMRKTYGFNKKEDSISVSQLVEITNLKKQNVSRALSKLITKRLVIKTDYERKKGNKLSINKDYEQWIPLVIKTDYKQRNRKSSSKLIQESSKLITPVIKTDTKSSSKLMDTKDKTISKETIQKKGGKISDSLEKKRSKIPPKQVAKNFFECVACLKQKQEHPFAETFKMMVEHIKKNNPDMPDSFIWTEIQDFTRNWTELSHDGKKEKWQLQKTFQVGGRLSTWFGNVKKWHMKQTFNKKNDNRSRIVS